MATRNIRTGKAGKEISAIYGWDEMKKKLKLITGAMAAEEAQAIVGAAAFHAYTEIKHSAGAVRIPHEVYEDIFMYNKPMGRKGPKVSALTGVRKRGRLTGTARWARAYVEWNPKGTHRRDKTVRVRGVGGKFEKQVRKGSAFKPGDKVGENLATMWELGTSKMAAKPFFRPAMERARDRILQILLRGYAGMIERYAKANL